MRELILAAALLHSAPEAATPAPVTPPVAAKETPRPMSLTAAGLPDELRRSATKRRETLEKLQQERAELERLAAAIEEARVRLREETARLEALLQQGEKSGCVATRAPAGEATTATTSVKPAGPVNTSGAQSLARTLKAMKPKQAAGLVERMELDVAILVLRQMSARSAAAVLSAMQPARAAALAAALANTPAEKGQTP